MPAIMCLTMITKRVLIIVVHGLVGWALCAATMFIGMATTTIENTLVVHAIAAPLFFAFASLIYVRYCNYTTPLVTAAIFLTIVVAIDLFLVALIINRSLDMFTSVLGTWVPFALIFASSYFTSMYAVRFLKTKERGAS